MRVFVVFAVLALSTSLLFTPLLQAQEIKVAIVIDDMGYRHSDHQALSLPGAVTYAFLPHTTYGKKLAEQAHHEKHEVLIHVPMESSNQKKLGPGAITRDMNKEAVIKTLEASLVEIPFAIGINNHMGSYLTQLYQPMYWTMHFLKQHQLLFLDSKTSADSQAEQAAFNVGVPVRARHVFLDNELTEQYIQQQFNQLIAVAKLNKSAIAIAHPHPESIRILTKLIPTLAQKNITLVPLSRLYQNESLDKVAKSNTGNILKTL